MANYIDITDPDFQNDLAMMPDGEKMETLFSVRENNKEFFTELFFEDSNSDGPNVNLFLVEYFDNDDLASAILGFMKDANVAGITPDSYAAYRKLTQVLSDLLNSYIEIFLED